MKKTLAILLAVMMLFSFAGCGIKGVPAGSNPAKVDIDLSEYANGKTLENDSCGYLYLPACTDADILAYINSDAGREELLNENGIANTNTITFSTPFLFYSLFDPFSTEGGLPDEGLITVGIQTYDNDRPAKMIAFSVSPQGEKYFGWESQQYFYILSHFVQSSEDKPVIIGVDMGSYGLYDGKVYKIESFSQYGNTGLTHEQLDHLKTVKYDKVVKIKI